MGWAEKAHHFKTQHTVFFVFEAIGESYTFSFTQAAMEEVENTIEHEIDNTSELVPSDDDFGDFEEVDQLEETDNQSNDLVESDIPHHEISIKNISFFEGKLDDDDAKISGLIDNILKDTLLPEQSDNNNDTFQLDERAKQILERLTGEDEYTVTQPTIWKQSMIYKHLLLNLEIPQDIDVTKRESISAGSTSTKQLYDIEETVLLDEDIAKILEQVPKFESLGISKKREEYSEKLSNTSSIISKIKNELLSDEESADYLEQLNQHKIELLDLLSVWNEHTTEVKHDNEIFTSYIENLIGNTQKLRRETRLSKKGKSRTKF